jgi:putative nucleotidyltransferase with HDIG domain
LRDSLLISTSQCMSESLETRHFSEPAAANRALMRALNGKDDVLSSIPAMSGVLQELLNELNQRPDQANLLQIAELIARDESLAAQCLRMANSPLFSRGPVTDSLRGAVRTLGLARIADIAVSCSLIRVVPPFKKGLDPVVFWQHSLACAIISRKLARAVGFGDPEKAYLAGLLHDLGYVVNLVLFSEQTAAAIEKAQREGLFMGDVEYSQLGFTHCQTGEILARKWSLPETMVEVILCHHDVATAVVNPALTAIVGLADRLTRASNLGLGFVEAGLDPVRSDAEWAVLVEKCPLAVDMSWSDFVKDSDSYVEEIRNLVSAICGKR